MKPPEIVLVMFGQRCVLHLAQRFDALNDRDVPTQKEGQLATGMMFAEVVAAAVRNPAWAARVVATLLDATSADEIDGSANYIADELWPRP